MRFVLLKDGARSDLREICVGFAGHKVIERERERERERKRERERERERVSE